MKIDLITGFLGAGKTSFLREYAVYLSSLGERIGILENDYGAVNVDMMMLSDLRSDKIELEMISGGCDYDCHVRRFKTKLISMAMSGYTRVLVEPSGIFDTDEFFDLVYDEPLDSWYEIGNVITLVDGSKEYRDKDSIYLIGSQLASAGTVIFTKTDKKAEEMLAYANTYLKEIGCSRVLGTCMVKKDKIYSKEELESIRSSGYHSYSYPKQNVMDENLFSSLCFMNLHLQEEEILEVGKRLFQTESLGHIHRVKGFVQKENSWYLLNMTKNNPELSLIPEGQDVFIVIGENLNEDAINHIVEIARRGE